MNYLNKTLLCQGYNVIPLLSLFMFSATLKFEEFQRALIFCHDILKNNIFIIIMYDIEK